MKNFVAFLGAVLAALVIFLGPNNVLTMGDMIGQQMTTSLTPSHAGVSRNINPNPDSVTLVACPSSNTRPINATVVTLDLFEGIDWGWAIKAWYRVPGTNTWLPHTPGEKVNTDGWIHCTNRPDQVGQRMALVWFDER